MTELKPCPFCGGEPTIDRHYIGQRKADYRIICKHCGARFFWFDRLFKATEAWNRRIENDAIANDDKEKTNVDQ